MLLRSGREGMNVRRLTNQLFNLHSDIFAADIDYGQLYNQVRSYLWRQSRLRHSPIVWLRWGQYALKSDIAVQLDIFIDMPAETNADESEQSVVQDDCRQLKLF